MNKIEKINLQNIKGAIVSKRGIDLSKRGIDLSKRGIYSVERVIIES